VTWREYTRATKNMQGSVAWPQAQFDARTMEGGRIETNRAVEMVA
jgi:hypothetical protein